MPEFYIQISFYVLIFISVILLSEVFATYLSAKISYKKNVNKRLSILDSGNDHEQILKELIHRRSLESEGRYIIPVVWFNRLLLQSGSGIGARNVLIIMFLLMFGSFFIAYMFGEGLLLSGLTSILVGFGLPIMWLWILQRRRHRKIEDRLPEALDVLRRSLQAGHPLSVAISMVARELPDPIGSEFGMTADEMTYGLDLEDALTNMGARIGQSDVSLLVIAVSIQSKTGGNLTELLSRLTAVIRGRQTLRRKVRALSAEGRFSALALSILPILVFFLLLIIAPEFYGDVWEHPWIKPTLGTASIFLMLGQIVMYRMVHFKF